jgi:hypothetical protein
MQRKQKPKPDDTFKQASADEADADWDQTMQTDDGTIKMVKPKNYRKQGYKAK